MRESREKEITVTDWSYVAFLAMLEYLYTGSICDITNEVVGLYGTVHSMFRHDWRATLLFSYFKN
jgi:hypothetical protein